MTAPPETLARAGTVEHPLGGRFTTPLLIPSFSSKGFRVTDAGSEIQDALDLACQWLTETMLVSAYDLTHGHVSRPEALPATPELIIVDSGGYETRIEHDMSTTIHWPHAPLPWDLDSYREELDRWPERFLASFVSYDDPSERSSLVEQVAAATDFFSRYPTQLHTFLVKPETADQAYLTGTIESVAQTPNDLARFHFIGVTEKELGSSMLERMENVARLRLTLDDARISAPIHVFGALDPLSCMLFFIAGAEVFDGLTWLRYTFHDGLCIYHRDYGAIEVGLEEEDVRVRARILRDNVLYLQKLSSQMESFVADHDFRRLGRHAELLAAAHESLCARLRGGA